MSINIYKATAKVGRDIIENAEYFSVEQNSNEKDKTIQNKLENFRYYISIAFKRTKYWIKDKCWRIRCGFQRMFKGYDAVDTFDIYPRFVKRYTKILTEYKKYLGCYAIGMTDPEWEAIIDEMLYHLHYMDEQNVEEELERNVPDNWMPRFDTVRDIMSKHKDEFFKLFSEYFYELWD